MDQTALAAALSDMRTAVDDEIRRLGTGEQQCTLTGGEQIAKHPDSFVYRFELSDTKTGERLANVEDVEISIPGKTLQGQILSVESQFIQISLTEDLGASIATLIIKWSNTLILKRLRGRLVAMQDQPADFALDLLSTLLEPTPETAARAPSGLSNPSGPGRPARNAEQQRATEGALANHVTFIWGPPGTGKTRTLGGIALELAKTGRRILLASNTNRAVDVALQNIIAAHKAANLDWSKHITRYGRPFVENDPDLQTVCFQNQVAALRAERLAEVQAILKLLDDHARAKAQVLRLKNLESDVATAEQTRAQRLKQQESVEAAISVLRHNIADLAKLVPLADEYFTLQQRIAHHKSLAETAQVAGARATEAQQKLNAALQSIDALAKAIAARKAPGFMAAVRNFLAGESVQTLESRFATQQRGLPELNQEHQAAAAAAATAKSAADAAANPETRQRLAHLESMLKSQAPEIHRLLSTDAAKAKTQATSTAARIGDHLNTCLRSKSAESQAIADALAKESQTLREKQAEIARLHKADVEANMARLQADIDAKGGEAALRARVDEQRNVDEKSLLAGKTIVAATNAKFIANSIFKPGSFDTLVVDEASMIGIPYLTALTGLAKKAVIVCGDPRQLPPIALATTPAAKRWMRRDIFAHAGHADDEKALFAWQERNTAFAFFLDTQYRMSSQLCNVISSLFYNGRLKNGKTTESEKTGVCVVDTSAEHPRIDITPSENRRFLAWNPLHATKIRDLIVQELVKNQQVPQNEIGVITPLNYTAEKIREVLEASRLRDVEVGTIHTFQGREKNVILFDTVMAGVNYTIRPFDERKSDESVLRLLNVALTRCKEFLCIFVDLSHFRARYEDRFILTVLNQIEPISMAVSSGPQQTDTPPSAPATTEDLLSKYLPKDAALPEQPLPSAVSGLSIPARTAPPGAPQPSPEAKPPAHAPRQEPPATLPTPFAPPPPELPPAAPAMPKPDKHAAKDILRYGTDINNLRSELNILYAKLFRKPAFNPSIESERITGQLPNILVSSESQFKDWIDMMYKHFYEASGGPNTGLPLVDKTSQHPSKIRWQINKLRNGFYHDSAQSSDPVAEQETQRRIYGDLIGKPYPTQPGEWAALQRSIMHHTLKWLEHVLSQLRK